jgi:hypothetical protein
MAIAEKFIEELYRRYHSDGPAFAAAAAAARAVAPTSTDPAEPCSLPSPSEAEVADGGALPMHHHHAAIGNSAELAMAPADR